VVWKLDRMARSLLHLLEILQALQARQVGLRILEGIGTQMNPATSEGKLFLSMLGA
jgi:DNA invertase Pin-like site-specific DNA recombinase